MEFDAEHAKAVYLGLSAGVVKDRVVRHFMTIAKTPLDLSAALETVVKWWVVGSPYLSDPVVLLGRGAYVSETPKLASPRKRRRAEDEDEERRAVYYCAYMCNEPICVSTLSATTRTMLLHPARQVDGSRIMLVDEENQAIVVKAVSEEVNMLGLYGMSIHESFSFERLRIYHRFENQVMRKLREGEILLVFDLVGGSEGETVRQRIALLIQQGVQRDKEEFYVGYVSPASCTKI